MGPGSRPRGSRPGLVRERELASSLSDGFGELWRKAMPDLHEIDFTRPARRQIDGREPAAFAERTDLATTHILNELRTTHPLSEVRQGAIHKLRQ